MEILIYVNTDLPWRKTFARKVKVTLSLKEDVVRRALCLPKELEPQAIITMGYPAEKPDPPARKRLSEIVLSVTPGGGLSRGEA